MTDNDKTDPTDDKPNSPQPEEDKERRPAPLSLADAERGNVAARLRERFSFGG